MSRLGRLTATPGAKAMIAAIVLLAIASHSFGQSDRKDSVDDQVRRNLNVSRYSIQALAVQAPADQPRDLRVGLTLDGRVTWLNLKPHSLRSPNFKLLVADAKGRLTAVEPPEENTYRGVIDGVEGSGVAASIVNGQFTMMIDDGATSWWVQPLSDAVNDADAGAYVVYAHDDVLPVPGVCGNVDFPGLPAQVAGIAAPVGAISCYYKTEIAFDTDVEYYVLNGSSAAAVDQDIRGVMSIVDFIYKRDCQITYGIGQIIVRTAVFAPYATTDPSAFLTAFQSEWNTVNAAIPRDVAHLMTGKDLLGGVLGIAVSLDGICTPEAYALSQTLFSTNMAERVTVTAHELGHNWGAPHCDNSPPCAANGVAVCATMCHALNSVCPNSQSLMFEPCTAQVIINYRNTRTCLGPAGSVGLGTEKIVANDSQINDGFGQAVSMSGDLMVVGAPQVDVLIPPPVGPVLQPDAGAAYIFRFNKTNSTWTQEAKLTAPDANIPGDDRFGISVAAASLAAGSVNGDTVVIGAHLDDDFGRNSGGAYVFQKIEGVWTDVAKLTAVDGAPNDLYGFSVSITQTGNAIAVGSQRDDDTGINSGSVYIYRHNGRVWEHEDKLLAPDAEASDGFGFSVSISGDNSHELLLAGALFDDDQGLDSGSAYVFRQDANNEWLYERKLLPTGGAAGDQFGLAVSLYAAGLTEIALVGAPLTNVSLNSNTGAAYVFTSAGSGAWPQSGAPLTGDNRAEDQFGAAVAITPQIAVVGDYLDDPVGMNSGSAFVFRNGGLGYSFDTKLIPDDASANDQFGISVTAYGERAAIGSWKSESPAMDGGAVYVTADAAPFVDCNMNGSPDECDLSLGFSLDCNLNGLPDECDIAAGTSIDCNLNGIPDECDGVDPADDCNNNGITDLCDIGSGFSQDCNLNAIPDECDIDDGTSEDCNGNGIPDECDVAPGGGAEDCNKNGVPDTCEITGPGSDCNTNGIPDICEIARGTAEDCNGNNVPDECDFPPGGTFRDDCNNNGIPDSCDVASGNSFDCNGNNIPDECDIAPGGIKLDCNNNGIPDGCDIANNFSEDCDLNGVPDECQLINNDCNNNDILDNCEITQGLAQDCNLNLVPDDCDIALGTSRDGNSDGIPDECQKILPCDADLTGSGNVDIDDLLVVIGAWGTCPPCPGDVDGNGIVDIDEILELIADWGVCPGCSVDFDGNGVVDIDDLLEIIGNWGPCPPCEGDINGDGFINIDDLLEIVGGWGPCP